MKIMTIRAPDNLQEELKEISQKYGMPRNSFVLKILGDYLEEWKKEQKE